MKVIDIRGIRGGAQTARALLSLRELLLTGELAPGQRVFETWVVERIGVSRTPVRAALVRLHEEGFLDPAPSAGYAVRTFSEQDALDAIEVRGALEGLAARRAAERGVDGRLLRSMAQLLARIDAVLATHDMSHDDLATYSHLNEAFHFQIAQACGGQTVPRLIERATSMPFAHPSGFVLAQSHHQGGRVLFELAQDQHRSLLDCLAKGEAARAENIMREHARLAARNLMLALEYSPQAAKLEGIHLIRRARSG